MRRAQIFISEGEKFPEHLYNALSWCRTNMDRENQEWCHENIEPAYSDWYTILTHRNEIQRLEDMRTNYMEWITEQIETAKNDFSKANQNLVEYETILARFEDV